MKPPTLRRAAMWTLVAPLSLGAAVAGAQAAVPAASASDAPTPDYRLPGEAIGVGATAGGGGEGSGTATPEVPGLRPVVYRYVDELDTTDPLAGLCRVAGIDPGAGLGPASGWTRLVQAFRRDTAEPVGEPEPVCVPLEVADDPEPPADVGSAPTAEEVWRAVPLPLPRVYASPPGRGIVALGTRVWTDGVDPVAVDVSLDGWTVTGMATPVGYEVDFDGEATARSSGPGTAAAPIGEWAFETRGVKALTVTTVWDAEVTWSAPGLAGITLAAGRARLAVRADYRVDEVRAVLVPR
jgi:hypothetical protein